MHVRDNLHSVFALRINLPLFVLDCRVWQRASNIFKERLRSRAKMWVYLCCRLSSEVINAVKCSTASVFLQKWRVEFGAPQALVQYQVLFLIRLLIRDSTRRP